MHTPKYTPRELIRECAMGGCPAVYEVAKECGVGACPTIYVDKDNKELYLIVGKRLDPKEFGLAEKVSQEETLVAIPKSLLDRLHLNKK